MILNSKVAGLPNIRARVLCDRNASEITSPELDSNRKVLLPISTDMNNSTIKCLLNFNRHTGHITRYELRLQADARPV